MRCTTCPSARRSTPRCSRTSRPMMSRPTSSARIGQRRQTSTRIFRSDSKSRSTLHTAPTSTVSAWSSTSTVHSGRSAQRWTNWLRRRIRKMQASRTTDRVHPNERGNQQQFSRHQKPHICIGPGLPYRKKNGRTADTSRVREGPRLYYTASARTGLSVLRIPSELWTLKEPANILVAARSSSDGWGGNNDQLSRAVRSGEANARPWFLPRKIDRRPACWREAGAPSEGPSLIPPETHYAKSGDVHIAYQVTGSGPFDLIYVPGFVSNLELIWESRAWSSFFTRLASFCRLIRFDKRGTGLSDRVTGSPSLEQRMDDVRAVMDATGSQRAALYGISEGGPMCLLFAATYPERVRALVLYGSFARHPALVDKAVLERSLDLVERLWGSGEVTARLFAPSTAGDEAAVRAYARFERQSASPSAMAAVMRMNSEIDARHVLPSVRTPTLVLHRIGDT